MSLSRRDLFAAGTLAALTSLAAGRARAQTAERVGSQEAHDSMAATPGIKMYGTEQVAMLLYPGFTALDLVGPHYFFGSMMGATVHLVAKDKSAPVPSDLGLAIQPTADFETCPKDLTILFAPGGLQGTLDAMKDAATIDFMVDRAARATWITSVCTGSLIMGQAGLLKGKRATSHWAGREALTLFDATPVNARIVTDGNVMTGAGVSAGLDLGLALTAELRGRGYAEALRLQAEYAPEPPVPGGTVETTDPAIAKLMVDMLAPFGGMVSEVAKLRR